MTSSSIRKAVINTRVLLVQRPIGLPKPSDFQIDEQQLTSRPPPNGLIVKTTYISIDPAMRGWMSDVKSYLPPVQLNDVMRASSIGEIVASNDTNKFPLGAIVKMDDGGVQSYVQVDEKQSKFLTVLPKTMNNVPTSAYLGVLGTTGLTGYFGFFNVGKPQKGDVVLVSGAAGATGSVVAQIAKNIMGCKVVGTAGSDDKCQWLLDNDIVDVAINYKQTLPNGKSALSSNIRQALGENKGANIVFDNVGGPFLEAALSNLSRGARIVLCGAISQYNQGGGGVGQSPSNSPSSGGPRNYMNLLVKRATMQGFVVFDYRKDYGKAIQDLSTWIQEGKIKYSEHVVDGIQNFHPALMTLFDGSNKGKVILKVSSSSDSDEEEKMTLGALRSKL